MLPPVFSFPFASVSKAMMLVLSKESIRLINDVMRIAVTVSYTYYVKQAMIF